MNRYCKKEYSYFDDTQFTATSQGFIHEVPPRHYSNGMKVQGPSVDPSATFWVPFRVVLDEMCRKAPEPLEGFDPKMLPCIDTDDEAAALRLEILRLTDRLSNEDLHTLLNKIRGHLSAPFETSL
jgi:hypothetical protein